MRRIIILGLLCVILCATGAFASDYYIKDLVLNYSDYSYISAVAVGFEYVYFATTNGVTRYNINTSEWGDPLTGIEGFSDLVVYDIAASIDDNDVWVLTADGILKYTEVFKRWDPVESIPPDEKRGKHLYPDDNYHAPIGYTYIPGGALMDDWGRIYQISDILDDTWSNQWVSFWGLGAARTGLTDRRIDLLNYGLLQPDITFILKDEDKLWITGSADSSTRTGLTIFTPENNEFEYLETHETLIASAYNVNDICSSVDEIYAAADDGVWIIDKENLEIVDHFRKNHGLPDDRIISVEVSGDTLFTGTQYGLGISSIYSDTSNPVLEINLDLRIILCLEKTENALWIGTDQGIFRYIFKTGQLTQLAAAEISKYAYIYDIKLDNNKMWVLSEDELYSINLKNAEVELFPEINHYSGIKTIAVKDSIIAASTDNGLLLIYNGRKRQKILYTIDDGLLSNQINYMVFDDQFLWIGSNRGLSRFWYKNPDLFW